MFKFLLVSIVINIIIIKVIIIISIIISVIIHTMYGVLLFAALVMIHAWLLVTNHRLP